MPRTSAAFSSGVLLLLHRKMLTKFSRTAASTVSCQTGPFSGSENLHHGAWGASGPRKGQKSTHIDHRQLANELFCL
jgi:hypothetical protein